MSASHSAGMPPGRERERSRPRSSRTGWRALLRSRWPRLGGETVAMRSRRPRSAPLPRSAFAGFRFPLDIIIVAARWYLRFGLAYRDVEELLADRGVEVDHVTVCAGCSGSRRCWPTPPAGSSNRRSARRASRPSRSRRIRRRCIRPCWRSDSRRPRIAPTSTPTTGSRPITADRRRGFVRCGGSNRTAVPGSSSSGIVGLVIFGGAPLWRCSSTRRSGTTSREPAGSATPPGASPITAT
jgi:hypothetical protein